MTYSNASALLTSQRWRRLIPIVFITYSFAYLARSNYSIGAAARRADSPLWTLPNVILSPHTAALSVRENERITELFINNVHRLDHRTPIRNRITAARRY